MKYYFLSTRSDENESTKGNEASCYILTTQITAETCPNALPFPADIFSSSFQVRIRVLDARSNVQKLLKLTFPSSFESSHISLIPDIIKVW
jgi:hypothetical protein